VYSSNKFFSKTYIQFQNIVILSCCCYYLWDLKYAVEMCCNDTMFIANSLDICKIVQNLK